MGIINRLITYLEEPGKAGVIGHVFRQVGEEHSQVEADLLGWVVEALCELHVVNLAIVVTVTAHKQEIDFLSGVRWREEEGPMNYLNFASLQSFRCHL